MQSHTLWLAAAKSLKTIAFISRFWFWIALAVIFTRDKVPHLLIDTDVCRYVSVNGKTIRTGDNGNHCEVIRMMPLAGGGL